MSSYKLYAVTRQPVREIGEARFFITMDFDSGYWQVECKDKSKAKLAFFTPNGKKRWRTMPMGASNAHPVFVALASKFKKDWDAATKKRCLKGYKSQVIVHYIMLSAEEPETLLSYLECVLANHPPTLQMHGQTEEMQVSTTCS